MDKTARNSPGVIAASLPRRRPARRSFWLKAFVLWTLGLGVIGAWRGIVLWCERRLLFELGGTLAPATLAVFVALSVLIGAALIASAAGLWWKKEWARQAAQMVIPAYLVAVQAYTWLFVRSGLMWERRWIALILALIGCGISLGALNWRTPRRWLGI